MIGERLKEIRKDHHDTQADLAKKLNISIFTVQSWEQEKSEPSHGLLIQICQLYHVTADYLLGLTDYDPIFMKLREAHLSPEEQKYVNLFADFLYEQKGKRK